jgi:hypothetical protein
MILALLLAIQTAARPTPVVLETPEGAREPQLAITGNGDRDRDVYATFGTKTGIYVSRSADDGRTFDRPVLVANVGSLALGMRRGPRIATPRRTVVVTAIAGEQGGGRDGDLICWRSENQGKTWQKGATINHAAGSAREGLHAIAQDQNGLLYSVWIDLETGSPRVLGSFSRTDGATWTAPVVIQGESAAICPCCAPAVSFLDDGRTIVVMWRSQVDGARDLVLATSSDHGKTFGPPQRVGAGTWKIDACPMDGGSLDWKYGTQDVAIQRAGKIYLPVGDKVDSPVGEGIQPWIAHALFSEASTYVVWLRSRGGPLELKKLEHDGSRESELDSVANDPVVVSVANESLGTLVLAAWESGDMEKPKLVVARVDEGPAKR